jgi:hypothetical protein
MDRLFKFLQLEGTTNESLEIRNGRYLMNSLRRLGVVKRPLPSATSGILALKE